MSDTPFTCLRTMPRRQHCDTSIQECLTIVEGDGNDVATLGKTLSGNQAHAWLGFNVHPKVGCVLSVVCAHALH